MNFFVRIQLNKMDKYLLTIKLRSDIIAPNVIDITGPINGETNIAAVIFGALFSISPSAANELFHQNTNFSSIYCSIIKCIFFLTQLSQSATDNQMIMYHQIEHHQQLALQLIWNELSQRNYSILSFVRILYKIC